MTTPHPLAYRAPRASVGRRRRCLVVLALVTVAALVPAGVWRGSGDYNQYRVRRIRQELTYRFDAALSDAARHVRRGGRKDLRAANSALDRARLARSANAAVFSAWELAALDARLEEQEHGILRAAILAPPDHGDVPREDVLGELYMIGLRLVREGEFTDALAVVDQIVVLDPADVRARLLRLPVAAAELVQRTLNRFAGA